MKAIKFKVRNLKFSDKWHTYTLYQYSGQKIFSVIENALIRLVWSYDNRTEGIFEIRRVGKKKISFFEWKDNNFHSVNIDILNKCFIL